MAKPFHPPLDAISLGAALHALSDPVRLEIVARLAQEDRLNCTGVCPGSTIPKSTLSHHLSVLRSAGLIETTSAGRDRINTLRRAAFDLRFPGLLETVLRNRGGDAPGLAPGGGKA